MLPSPLLTVALMAVSARCAAMWQSAVVMPAAAFQLQSITMRHRRRPPITIASPWRQRHTSALSCRMVAAGGAQSNISCRMMASGRGESSSFVYTSLDDAHNECNITCRRDLAHVLHTIEKAAYSAGEIALSNAGRIAVKSTKANVRDLVTESDVECQRLIKDIVLQEFPRDVFLGEEDIDLSGDSSSASSEALRDALGIAEKDEGGEERLLFVVDPIDGTTNFQAGLPIYAMSIGVVSLSGKTPEVVAGVIYNPVRNKCSFIDHNGILFCLLNCNFSDAKTLGEMTSAVRGRGAYLNNKRIVPNQGDNTRQPRESILGESLVNVGFPVCKESTLLASSRAVTALATKVRGLRMVACASQTMAWVAHGKFSSYFSWDLNAWDVAAGVVIVEEAGGLVSNFDGTKADVSSRDMIITCSPDCEAEDGLLRDELIQVLEDNDCIKYE